MTAERLLEELEKLGVEIDAAGDELRIRAERGVMDADLRARIVASKPALLGLLRNRQTERDAPLRPVSRESPLPMSEFQEGLWTIGRLEPESTVHQFVGVWRFHGVASQRVRAAVADVLRRHEILRSIFTERDGARVVEIGPVDAIPVRLVAVTGDVAARERLVMEALAEELRTPFDLSNAPPVRFRLWDDNAGAALLVCIHHIAADDWSMALLRREVDRALDEPGAPAPALQFADYAAFRRRLSKAQAGDADLAWWETRLAGAPELCVFPADLPGGGRSPAAVMPFALDAGTTRELNAIARREGATSAMAAYAAYAIVLRAHTGLDDIVFGVPLGVRERPELEAMIGPFVNLVVLRLDLSDDPSFVALLRRAREAFLDAYAHRDVPFNRIVQRLNPARSSVHGPIFQSAVVMHNATGADDGGGDSASVQSGGAMNDVTWYLRERDGRLCGSIEYRADLFEAETMRRIATRLARAMVEAAADPDRPIGAYELMDAQERALVIDGFNATVTEVDARPVPERFAEQAARTPDAIALGFDGRRTTYAELAARAGAFARAVVAAGGGPGARIGVCLERGPDMVAALLGVQAAGAAYVPLDPNFPAERLAFMLEDSGILAIVSDEASRDKVAGAGTPILDVARIADAAGPAPSVARPDQLAYVIYTSGSTGRPNGVAVSHAALSNFLHSMAREPGLSRHDVLAAVTTISFDIAGLELYLPLVTGARIELVPHDVAVDGEALADCLARSNASVLQATPATWRLLLEAGWTGAPGFRALVGGEPLPPDLAAALLPRVEALWNLYGPTETTVWSTVSRVRAADHRIDIGRPIANTRVYILDADMRPVPIGLIGEIWIGGAGLAEGYHARVELTAERFRPDPFVGGEARIYRTGDLGRRLPDGRLVHLGRRDHQVKVRGFRIELGDIETALMQHPAVNQAVAVARELANGTALVAYTVSEAGLEPTVSDLRRFLRARLPDYMTPAIYVSLDRMPLTPNGKLDRKALPDTYARGRRAQRSQEPLRPGAEQLLAEVWRELLERDDIGPNDNFFELGGHSLLALRVSTAVARRTGWRLEPRALFFQTLRDVAKDAARHQVEVPT